MTSRLTARSVLSSSTVAALEDLGYHVDAHRPKSFRGHGPRLHPPGAPIGEIDRRDSVRRLRIP